MRPLLSPRQMARADAATIEAGTPAEVLMERAGAAVARTAVRAAGGRYGRRAAVVCGGGNNGGDGFVAARRLHREGLAVTCLTVVDPEAATGAARHHLELMRAEGLDTKPFSERGLAGADVVVDAIFGTGFRGRAEGGPGAAVEAVNRAGARVVAVDIPSGVDGTTGAARGPALLAARGAVRMGAGYATLGATPATDRAKAAVLPEVLSVVASDGEALGPGALDRFGEG